MNEQVLKKVAKHKEAAGEAARMDPKARNRLIAIAAIEVSASLQPLPFPFPNHPRPGPGAAGGVGLPPLPRLLHPLRAGPPGPPGEPGCSQVPLQLLTLLLLTRQCWLFL